MTEHSKKRLSPRYEVRDRFGSFGWEIHGDLLNIGLGGMALRLATYLEPEMIVKVSIQHDGGILGLDGAVRWCRAVGAERAGAVAAGQGYEVGIGFTGDLDVRSDALLDFISRTPTLSVKRGTFGRFVLDYDRPVQLRARCPIRVRRLSLSGMLVETQAAPELDSEVHLSIPFGRESFLARGRVVNVAGGEEGGSRYRVGIGFDVLTGEERPLLQTFVEDARRSLSRRDRS